MTWLGSVAGHAEADCVVIVLAMCTVSGGRVWRAGACGIAQHGYCIPDAPVGNPSKMIQINHAIVDEKRLRYTGNVPLD